MRFLLAAVIVVLLSVYVIGGKPTPPNVNTGPKASSGKKAKPPPPPAKPPTPPSSSSSSTSRKSPPPPPSPPRTKPPSPPSSTSSKPPNPPSPPPSSKSKETSQTQAVRRKPPPPPSKPSSSTSSASAASTVKTPKKHVVSSPSETSSSLPSPSSSPSSPSSKTLPKAPKPTPKQTVTGQQKDKDDGQATPLDKNQVGKTADHQQTKKGTKTIKTTDKKEKKKKKKKKGKDRNEDEFDNINLIANVYQLDDAMAVSSSSKLSKLLDQAKVFIKASIADDTDTAILQARSVLMKIINEDNDSNSKEKSTFGSADAESLVKVKSEALNLLGELAIFSRFQPDIPTAASFFQQASDLGNADSQHNLAFLYGTGLLNGMVDDQMAVLYEYFAAMGGSNRAKMSMGYRHMHGYGVPMTCDSAVTYYSQVAKHVIDSLDDEPIARVIERSRLTDESSRTQGPEGDDDVIQYYSIAADTGDRSAQVALGHLHYYGARGLEQNPQLAARYFQAAADQGDPQALANLGQMYLDGVGVEQNNKTAYTLLKKAANMGFAAAQSGLGSMYLGGYHVAKDAKHALHYFKLAAEQGDSEAQYQLGMIYAHGIGVDSNMATAMQYFAMSGHSGHTRALFNLGQMHLNGLGTVQSCELGIKFMKTVAERGEWATALSDAHELYKQGDVAASILKYARAAEEGVELAQSNAAWLWDQEAQGAFPSIDLPLLNTSISWIDTHHQHTTAGAEAAAGEQTQQPPHYAFVSPSLLNYFSLAGRSYLHASAQGNIDALRVLGDYAYYGHYPQSIRSPNDQDEKDLDDHDPSSSSLLSSSSSKLEAEGDNRHVNYVKAAQYYEQAGERGNLQSRYNLGYMHEYGIGLPKDFHLAKRYYDNAYSTKSKVPVNLALFCLKIHEWALEWGAHVGLWEYQNINPSATAQELAGQQGIQAVDTSSSSSSSSPSSSSKTSSSSEDKSKSPSSSPSSMKKKEKHPTRQADDIHGSVHYAIYDWSIEDILLLILCLCLAVVIYFRSQ